MPLLGNGCWHKLLLNHGQEVLLCVDAYKSTTVGTGFERATINRAWRHVSLQYLQFLDRDVYSMVLSRKMLRAGSQCGKVFMQVYLNQKFPADIWQQDHCIIVATLLKELILNEEHNARVKMEIVPAIRHLSAWHKKMHDPSHTTSNIQRTFTEKQSVASSILVKQNKQDNVSSTTSEISLAQQLLLLLHSRQDSDDTKIDPLRCMHECGITTFAHIQRASKAESLCKDQSRCIVTKKFHTLLQNAANFMDTMMTQQEPSTERIEATFPTGLTESHSQVLRSISLIRFADWR